MTRPRGEPPTPRAASSDRQPLGITLTGTSTSRLPSRMIEPLPYDFSICEIAASSNFCFSSAIFTPRSRKVTSSDILPPSEKGEDSAEVWFGLNQSTLGGFLFRPYRAASRQASGSGLAGSRVLRQKNYTKDLRLVSQERSLTA